MRRHNTESDLDYVRSIVKIVRAFQGDDKDLEYDLLVSFESKEDEDFENLLTCKEKVIH